MMEQSSQHQPDEKRHPIQVVARRSGLSPDVLRAWEKRYRVVAPARSDGGRRLYSDADIERLRLLQQAMSAGRRIGQLAQLPTGQLTALVDEDRAESVVGPDASWSGGTAPRADAFLVECLAAVRALEPDGLRSAFGRAVIALRPEAFINEVATPLMHRIGALWARGDLTPGHEHLATVHVRQALGEVASSLQPGAGAPRLIVATPVGQRHEIGALLVAATAAAQGWHVTFLGGDLPAADIARAANQTDARVVALSVTHPEGDPRLTPELSALRQALPREVSVLVGGQAVRSYRRAILASGAQLIPDLPTFGQALAVLSPQAH